MNKWAVFKLTYQSIHFNKGAQFFVLH